MTEKSITREFLSLKDGALKEEVYVKENQMNAARGWTGQDQISDIKNHVATNVNSLIQEDVGAHEIPYGQKLVFRQVKSLRSLFRYSASSQLRKPRRRWTEELHHCFLIAVQYLGGAFAATPSQIKQLMGVRDLTYYEIQSHLQRHRMHIRRA